MSICAAAEPAVTINAVAASAQAAVQVVTRVMGSPRASINGTS
jgi:hypothetical protein